MSEAGGAADAALDGGAEGGLGGPDFDGLAGAGEAGVEEFAGGNGAFAWRQDEGYSVEFGALRLVHRERPGGFVRRQAGEGHAFQGAVRAREP